jgi:Amiloride-sensitive sodium channel
MHINVHSRVEIFFFLFVKAVKTTNKVHPLRTKNTKFDYLINFILSYLKESSIHSFNHTVNQKQWFQRLFWIVCFVISMFGFEFMSREVYGKLKSTTITSSISSRPISVEDIPFPAVTITTEFDDNLKTSQLDSTYMMLYYFPSYYTSIYEEMIKEHTHLQSVVQHFICYKSPEYYRIETAPFSYASNHAFVDFLKANQTANRQLWFDERRITWNSKTNASFAETLTRYGLGFSFNLILANDLFDFER